MRERERARERREKIEREREKREARRERRESEGREKKERDSAIKGERDYLELQICIKVPYLMAQKVFCLSSDSTSRMEAEGMNQDLDAFKQIFQVTG